MANYVKSTNFAVKDGLPSGDPLKVVKGTEIDTEFNNIATSVASKADISSPTFLGTPFAPTAATGTNTNQIATTAFVQAQKEAERTATATLTNKTLTTPVLTTPKMDVINENTSGFGVTVDGVLLKDGSVATSALASGTADDTTFLRGDRTWATINVRGQQLFTSSGTFTVPAGVSLVKVTVVGGGGGGGAGTTVTVGEGDTVNYSGGFGGGGGISVGYVSVTPGGTVSVTVGGGGTGSNSGSGSGGGTSSFGSALSATGGAGGGAASSGGSGSSGAGGVGSGATRNFLLSVNNTSVTAGRSSGGVSPVSYSLGAADGALAGARGYPETSSSGNDAAGGVGGAVMIEW